MAFRYTVLVSLLFMSAVSAFSQEQKRALTVEDLVGWQRITRSSLSDDGNLIAVKHEPWKGDATVLLYHKSGKELARFSSAGDFAFSPSSRFFVVEEKTPLGEWEKLKLKKTKHDQMPLNKLVLYTNAGRQETLDSIRTYKLAKATDWLAYKRGNKKDSTLYVRSLDGKVSDSIPRVADFGFADEGTFLYYVSTGDSVATQPGIYIYQTAGGKQTLLKEGDGSFKTVSFNKKGDKLAFLYAEKTDNDSIEEKNRYALYFSDLPNPADLVTESGKAPIPSEWIISQHGDIRFSEDGQYLYFPTAPTPRERDTTVLAENRPDVQVWNWNETVQYTQQVVDRKKDERKTYTVAYHFRSKNICRLNTPELPYLQLPEKGDIALLSTNEPYGTARMWTGNNKQDIYTINLQSGVITALLKEHDDWIRISPEGKFAYWYNDADSAWFTCALKENRIYRLTTPNTFQAWDADNDVPDYPGSYGAAGWSKADRYLLLYDKNNIWRFDPQGTEKPLNLTVDGVDKRTSYRIQRLDREVKSIDLSEAQLLTGFNEETKATGFYRAVLSETKAPTPLLTGNFKASFKVKAKKADALLYTTETFEQYPEMRYTDLRFKNKVQLTHQGKQQDSIRWGTAELTSWISLDGKVLEGVIYKPANFDPAKKYPLIVNFYERNSESLYAYRMPEPHRSTVDYHLYNSHDYIIFNPDVRYEDGYPGESCFNSVMPGITALIAKGYINEKAIAAQGHSWGGYQVAYLATRTNLFAAIESGAPVVNMFSAYGGIRWGTGLNRSFQYEHGQSRIGATPWESPLRYQENSPLFTMDKVNTPILIMHNDADGHVPWYQGIEYFVALKRLQKPVWLLNYTGEPHWPMKMANRIDFQKRMFQFFDHYLKGSPMPLWMKEGVKVVDQPFELGY